MDDMLYEVEYAKSSNSLCKACGIKIPKGVVRIAILLQSTTCDKKYYYWYHECCFLKKRTLTNVSDIHNFDKLLKEDQERIKAEYETYSMAPVLPETSKIRKRNFKNIDTDNLSTFSIEYAKSSNATCICCNVKICKNVIRISKFHYNPRYGKIPMWYHVQCFIKKRDELLFFAGGECIPGFENLNKEDQVIIKNEINSLKDGVISKMLKQSSNNNITAEEEHNIRNKNSQAINTRSYPLKNLQFYLHGKLKTTKEKLKERILGLGGLVVKNIISTIAAVVTTKKQLSATSTIVEKIKDYKIEVIDESFFDIISMKNGTVIDSINHIIQHNIADWKSDPFKRIPQSVIEGKSIEKVGSMYKNFPSVNVTELYVNDYIPIDSRSKLESIAHIYREKGKIYSDQLAKADVVVNKNSFYRIELWESNKDNKYWIFRAWGRIGTKIGKFKLTSYTSIANAKKKYLKIYAEKTIKRRRSTRNLKVSEDDYENSSEGYVPVDLSYADLKRGSFKMDTDSKLSKSVQLLLINIFDTEIMKKTLLQFELDVEKMPLGKLSTSQIKAGYTILSELMQEFSKNTASQKKITKLSSQFYSLIPHSVGIDKLPLLDRPQIIKEKEEMLDSLLEIEVAYKLLHIPSDDSVIPIESHYLKLKTDICPVDKNEPDFHLLLSYIKNTHAPTHSNYQLEVTEIFRIVREGEVERYEKFKQLHNKRLLWHGSRMTNLVGILSQGLRIAPREAPQTGKMFGNGIYFADISSKSANYCFADKTNSTGYIFVCEVALGEMKKCYKAVKITKLPEGKHSTWGVGQMQPDPLQNKLLENGVTVPLGTLVSTKVRSTLLYNEFIVYDVAQVNVKYLVQLNFKFK